MPVVVTVMPMIVLAVGVTMVVPVVVSTTGAVHMGRRGGGDAGCVVAPNRISQCLYGAFKGRDSP